MKPLRIFHLSKFCLTVAPPLNQPLFINQTYFSSYRSQNQRSFGLFWQKYLVTKSVIKLMILLTFRCKVPGSQKTSFMGAGSRPVLPIPRNVHPSHQADHRALLPVGPIWRELGDGQGRVHTEMMLMAHLPGRWRETCHPTTRTQETSLPCLADDI